MLPGIYYFSVYNKKARLDDKRAFENYFCTNFTYKQRSQPTYVK